MRESYTVVIIGQNNNLAIAFNSELTRTSIYNRPLFLHFNNDQLVGPFTSLTATVTGPQGNENHKIINTIKVIHKGVPSDESVLLSISEAVVTDKAFYSCSVQGQLSGRLCTKITSADLAPQSFSEMG